MFTVKQAADFLGVSEQTVYSLCSQRKIAFVRIGAGRGTIRIRQQDLDEFIRGALVKAEDPPSPPLPRGTFKHLKV